MTDVRKVKELPENPSKKELFKIKSNNIRYLTHTYHKYPAKFIPHIPRWGIKKYGNENSTIFDPFAGSGTTAVETVVDKKKAVGTDIDPLSVKISKVKTTPINPNKLREIVNEVIEKIEKLEEGSFRPELDTDIDHWFTREAQNSLSIIRTVIDDYKNEENIYNFLIITYSSIIREVSNADNQSQKTYVSHTKEKTPKPVISTFKKRLKKYSERMRRFYQKVGGQTESNIQKHDATEVTSFADENNLDIDHAITSPPYNKAVDYVYNQMAELFWIGDLFDLQTQSQQNDYKQKYVGTKKVYKNQYKNRLETGIEDIDKFTSIIREKDQKHGYILSKYFNDMLANFEEMYELLPKGGHYVVVVGNNKVSGEIVENDAYLKKCAENVGFEVDNHFGYKIRNRYMRIPRGEDGNKVKFDWIIDLKK